MKTFTLKELQNIAAAHGGYAEKVEDEANVYARIIFYDGSCIDFTEKDVVLRKRTVYYGQVFRGTKEQADKHVELFNDMESFGEDEIDWLTVERAKELIGKRVECRYDDVNQGIEKFFIAGMEKRKSNQIGQKEKFVLLTQDVEEDELVDHKRKVFTMNGKYFQLNGCQFIIDGKFQEFKKYARVEDLKKLFKTEKIIPLKDAKTGDAEGLVVSVEPTADWYYEWQGIFRRGSGAERLAVVEVID